MTDWREDRVRAALEGRNPTVIAELDSSFAVIGDVQFLPGYSLALTKRPGVDRLSDLARSERLGFLSDVDLLASAVERVCADLDRDYRGGPALGGESGQPGRWKTSSASATRS